MRNWFKYGGIAASVILIVFGIGSIAIGAWGISPVRDNLKQEQIFFGEAATDPDVPADQSGKQVKTGSQAHGFAEVMRNHALEATEDRSTQRWDASSTRRAIRPPTSRRPRRTKTGSRSRTRRGTSG